MQKIILYYKYIDIEDPENICNLQKELCNNLNLKGRIIIAKEGINGTLGGSIENIDMYINQMQNNINFSYLFKDIDFKYSYSKNQCFERLKIVVKNEIVRLGIDPNIVKAKDGALHLDPEQVHELITKKPEDLIILDARNNYESRIGNFINSVTPDINTFREFPKYIDENTEKFKNKKILMYCTGGVRCERASAYLKSKNIAKEVYQIKGGIHKYVEKYKDSGYFKGKNYVFDSRISLKVTDDILAQCCYCNKPYDDYTNCINAECNIQIIVCQNCIENYHNTCSKKCLDLVQEKKVNIRKKSKKIIN